MIDWKLVGMTTVFGTAVWTGFSAAASVRRTVRQLRELKLSLEVMRCEVSFRLTPIRKMCGILADASHGEISRFYAHMGRAMHRGQSVCEAAEDAFAACKGLSLPDRTRESLRALFSSFGAFDYSGQLRMIEFTAQQTDALLARLEAEKSNRCRSYELLGACAGLAIVILIA